MFSFGKILTDRQTDRQTDRHTDRQTRYKSFSFDAKINITLFISTE